MESVLHSELLFLTKRHKQANGLIEQEEEVEGGSKGGRRGVKWTVDRLKWVIRKKGQRGCHSYFSLCQSNFLKTLVNMRLFTYGIKKNGAFCLNVNTSFISRYNIIGMPRLVAWNSCHRNRQGLAEDKLQPHATANSVYIWSSLRAWITA